MNWWRSPILQSLFAIALILMATNAAVMAQFSDLKASDAQADSAPALAGTLLDQAAWRAYKARFVTEQGRVVDTGNAQISHSEGQGYGLVLAVAAGDRDAFDRIWGWTRANLMVRGDELLAWRWEPDKRPAIADMNNATDGDLLVAWALTEADSTWKNTSYRIAARRIAVEVGRKLILPQTQHGSLLLPALAGFAAEERQDGPVVNLSYWVFPALDRLPTIAPEFDWAALSRSGYELLRKARFGAQGLPVEWTALGASDPHPATGFAPSFAYNAIRIPLYLAWSGIGRESDLAPFVALWAKHPARGLPLIDTAGGRQIGWLEEKGYAAIADLAACAASGTKLPASFKAANIAENYYPATLHLLAQIAAQMRYPSCLRG
ncbi:MAG: cellulase [Rhodopseudomonas sp.]|nr:cellulase [Rhodopseudomonas sp.]